MGMFNSMRKPRGFNHQYIYVDERKEIRGKFVEGTTHLKRRKASGRKPVSFGIILIIIAFLLYLWHYLATGSWSF